MFYIIYAYPDKEESHEFRYPNDWCHYAMTKDEMQSTIKFIESAPNVFHHYHVIETNKDKETFPLSTIKYIESVTL